MIHIVIPSEDWPQSIQDAITYRGFYVIKVHDLIGNFSAVPGGESEKLWREFFSSQWWDQRSEKVIDYQSCQRLYISMGPLLLLVSILLLSPSVAILPWSVLWQKCFSDPCTGGTVAEGKRKCSIL